MAPELVMGKRLWERARRVLPGGVSSNVKMEEHPRPMFFTRAEGSHLVDADGRTYIDYTCGYGPVILGHAHAKVVEALQAAAARGLIFGGQHEAEVLLAERLAEAVPCVEMVRYNCTGSEAVHAAIRLARAHTGRLGVIRFEGHYHGWFDDLLMSTHPALDARGAAPQLESRGQAAAASQHVVVAPWNDLSALEELAVRCRGQIAAVLMEPIMCNAGGIMPAPGYLEGVRAMCDREGIVLIFDEVITGFRVALGGAQELPGVKPDLATFGKAMANGFPISALGGRREIMGLVATGGVVHAGAFNGNPLGVAAAVAMLEELARDGGAAYRYLAGIGDRLMSGIREVASFYRIPVLLQGPGPVFYMWFTDAPSITDYRGSARIDRAPYARFAAALLTRGVRVIPGGRWPVSCAHTQDDVPQTLDAVAGALDETFR